MSSEKKYPVYSFHGWELLAIANTLSGFLRRRAEEDRTTDLDDWLTEFTEKILLLSSVLLNAPGENGVAWLRKPDRDLVKKLTDWYRINHAAQ